MSKRLTSIFFTIVFYLALSSWKSQSAVYSPPPGSEIPGDSITAAMERGDSIIIDRCEILGSLRKQGTKEKPDTINSFIDIELSTFHDTVFFSTCHFTSQARFTIVFFLKRVIFSGVTFGKDVFFVEPWFKDFADFWPCNFSENAYFWGASFTKQAHFLQTEFNGKADFSNATFPEGGLFQNVTFGGETKFFEASFSKDANFQNATFAGEVDFSSVKFENIIILWKQLAGHLICDTHTAFKLMKYFEERRMLDDADGVYLFLKDQERMKNTWYIRYPEYWFIQQTCGYGVQPQNTLYISVSVIILLASLYFFANGIRPRMGVRKATFFDTLYFSFQTFIIGVVADWHPTDQFLIKIKRFKFLKFRTLSMIEGALGWILVILFIISLGRKFIR